MINFLSRWFSSIFILQWSIDDIEISQSKFSFKFAEWKADALYKYQPIHLGFRLSSFMVIVGVRTVRMISFKLLGCVCVYMSHSNCEGVCICLIYSVLSGVYYWGEWWKRDVNVSCRAIIVVVVTKYVYTVHAVATLLFLFGCKLHSRLVRGVEQCRFWGVVVVDSIQSTERHNMFNYTHG